MNRYGRAFESRLRSLIGRHRLSLPVIIGLCIGVELSICNRESLASCVDCHKEIDAIAVGEMAEQIKRLGQRHGDPAGCVVCHGGDPAADNTKDAHTGTLETLEESGGPKAFYADPGATWVADYTCGQCHAGYARRWRKSVMSTEAGSIERELCAPAWQKRHARKGEPKLFGRYAISDKEGSEPAAGSRAYKAAMQAQIAKFPRRYPARLLGVPAEAGETPPSNLPPVCGSCHWTNKLSRGQNGCSVCHIPERMSQGRDGALANEEETTIKTHKIQGTGNTSIHLSSGEKVSWFGISRENCFRCHFDPRLAGVNEIGDAFVHYGTHKDGSGEGLMCQDCHTSIEMHGDGNIAATSEAQSEIRCEDCHGNQTQFPWELPLGHRDPEFTTSLSQIPRGIAKSADEAVGLKYSAKDGYLLTSRGNIFGNLVKDGSQVFLHSVAGKIYDVPLLKSIAEQKAWRSELSQQVKSVPQLHQNMACMDCHADWLPPCLGCHAEQE